MFDDKGPRISPYLSAGENFIARTQTSGSQVLPRLARAVVDVGALILMSDRDFRAAERREAMRAEIELAKIARSKATEQNNLVLSELATTVPALIRELQAEIGAAETPDLRSFGETLRAQLMSLDIKGKDAGRMNDELEKCLDMSKRGGSDTCKYLNTKVEELHELRSRRPTQNDPAAVVLGAIFTALGVGHMISCVRAGSCGTLNNIAIAMGLFILAATFFAIGAGTLYV